MHAWVGQIVTFSHTALGPRAAYLSNHYTALCGAAARRAEIFNVFIAMSPHPADVTCNISR